MPAFNAPNPYGSYFDFGQPPESMAAQSFLPGMNPGFSRGVASMMGAPSGGFNPTAGEFLSARMTSSQYNQFMADVLRTDPRAGAMQNLMLQQMFGKDDQQRKAFIDRLGGQDRFSELFGFMLAQPGISGMMGGSVRSLGIGSLAISTSGMRVGGFGGSSMLMGDSYLSEKAAGDLYRSISPRFYMSSGAAIQSATAGLNRDQIGGIMTLGAQQGAFGGLDMGSMERAAGGTRFNLNSNTMDKIAKFTKDAAKTLASLIDIYGDASVGELAQKAQQITGLDFSKLQNIDSMRSRLNNIRQGAYTTGTDLQTAMDLAAGGTAFGQRLGMSSSVAGSISSVSSVQAMYAARQSQANAGVMFMPQITMGEHAFNIMRDSAAMTRDPLGSRRAAVEMMIQTGVINSDQASFARAQARGATPQTISQLDQAMQNQYHVNLPGYINMMGGSDSLMSMLTPEGQEAVIGANADDFKKRQNFLVTKTASARLARTSLRGNFAAASKISEMVSSLGVKAIDDLSAAVDSHASDAEMRHALAGDQVGSRDPSRFTAMAADLKRSLGTTDSLQGIMRDVRMSMRGQKLLQTFESDSDKSNRLMADAASRSTHMTDDDLRVIRSGGLIEGILQRGGGSDPASVFAMTATTSPERVAGLKRFSLNFDKSRYFDPRGRLMRHSVDVLARNMASEFSHTPEGKDVLKAFSIGGFHDPNRSFANDREAADFLNRVTDRITRDSVLGSKFVEYSLGTGTAYITKHDAHLGAEAGPLGLQADLASKAEQDYGIMIRGQADKSTRAGLLGSLSQIIRTGRMQMGDRSFREYNEKEQQDAARRYRELVVKYSEDWPTDVVSKVVGNDRGVASQIITDRHAMLQGLMDKTDTDSTIKKAKYQKDIDEMRKKGGVSTGASDEKVQQISGTLKLLGDGWAKLNGTETQKH